MADEILWFFDKATHCIVVSTPDTLEQLYAHDGYCVIHNKSEIEKGMK